mmetsp:Transcript_2939/g.3359  ORF Transcript_2939/g.3359 Transcript_2939/m.3359 type:complete len:209 (+) Transcript_2939:3-629(+)
MVSKTLTGVLRDYIKFADLPYTTDLHMMGTFRQPAGIPDDIFPDAWRNDIKKKTCTAAAAVTENDNEEDQNCQWDNAEEEEKDEEHHGPMVEATDSSNATASTQGVRAGTAHTVYNTRTPDVPSGYYYTEEAKAAGLEAEAVWYAEQEARSSTTTMTPTTTDNDNSGEGHDISGDDGIRDGGPGRDRDQDNDPQASMEAIMHNRMLHR